LDDNILIIKLIKGFYLSRPPSRALAQPWDLSLVMDLSLVKTAFLLALATMCRGSELQAFSVEEDHCCFANGGVTLSYNSTFLAKNERPNVILKDAFIPTIRSVGS
jgi:hypothetical protein